MREYVFNNIRNSNIEIKVRARNYTHAMDQLLSITRDIDVYRLKSDNDLAV